MNDERKPGSWGDIDADGAIDTVVRRMTAAADDATSASEARVLARIRTQAASARADSTPGLSAVPRLAWAALILIALAAGSLWLASRQARVQPQSAAVVTRPSSPATAPARDVAPARDAGPDRARLASRAPAGARPADAHPGEDASTDVPGLPSVPRITVASIEPTPLAAPAPLATDAVTDGSAITIDRIAIEPIDADVPGANSHARGPQ